MNRITDKDRPVNAPARHRVNLMLVFVAAGLLAGLQACGDAGTTDRSKAQIRLVNATGVSSGYPQLALRLNDELRQGQVAYGDSAAYAEVDDGSPTLTITTPTSASALLTAGSSLSKGRYYTALAFGHAGAARQLLLDDNQAEPDVNKSLLRVVNAAPEGGALDIYLTGRDDELTASVPLQAGAGYGVVGGWLTVGSATWRLRVTAAGSKSDVRVDQQGLVLSSRQIATLVLTPGAGGVLVNALVLTQRGSISRQDNPQARVRLAAGLHGAGNTRLLVGGDTVASGVPSPTVGNYTRSGVASPAVELSVANVPIIPTGVALAAGGDHTLLVFGSTNLVAQQAGALAPRGVWLPDNNRAPTDSALARLRLVNGLADSPGTLALSADFFSLATGVAAGAASPYADTAAGTTITLSVNGSTTSTALYEAGGQTLVAGATYSVFVVGLATAPAVIVRRDR